MSIVNLSLIKNIFRYTILTVITSIWLSSCRSHVMPCPSFSHLSQEEAYQAGNGTTIKFDKNGRVKK